MRQITTNTKLYEEIRSFRRKNKPAKYTIPMDELPALFLLDRADRKFIKDTMRRLRKGELHLGGPLPKKKKRFIAKLSMPEPEEPIAPVVLESPSPPKEEKDPSVYIAPAIDKRLFIEGEFTIIDKESKEVPFKLNAVQEKYYNLLVSEYGKSLDGTREIILKARQEGFSSLILALFTVDFITVSNSVSICISHNRADTEKLFRKVHHYIESYCKKNGFDPVQYLSIDTKSELENATNKAYFYIRTAGSKIGGRGGTARNIHFCLSGESLVMRHDGVFIPIQFIKRGDIIVDGNGHRIKVFDLSKRSAENKEFKRISVFGSGDPISATVDHKMLTLGKNGVIWKQVKELTENDFVAFPLRKIRSDKKNFSVARKKHSSKDAFGKIPFSYEFGQFVGWYLAEGTATKNHSNITLCVHHDEAEQVLKICEVVRPLVTSISSVNRDNHRTIISINGRSFRHAFSKKFGLSSGKRIPYDVYRMGRSFLRGLVLGYVEGDGQITEDKVLVCGIRQNLIYSWARIVSELGYGVPAIYKQPAGHRYGRNNSEQWTVSLMGEGADNFKRDNNVTFNENITPQKRLAREQNKKWVLKGFGHSNWKRYAFHKVEKIEEEESQEFMYDIVLDADPHSFSTSVGISSNSEAAFFESTEKITATEIIEATIQQVPMGKGMIFMESTGGNHGTYFQIAWERAKRSEIIYHPRFFSWEEFYTDEFIQRKRLDYQTEEKFLTDYPKTDDEAFIFSGSPFFDRKTLQWIKENTVKDPMRMGRLATDGEWI